MAFNPDAFNAGLGGILQQILSSRQQTQAMQQKRADEEIPLFNQQRAWTRENAADKFTEDERNNQRLLWPGQKTIQEKQIEGMGIANEGGKIGNETAVINKDTAGINRDVARETKPDVIATAKNTAMTSGSQARLAGNQATVSDAALPGATTEAQAATPLKAAEILERQITKRDAALGTMAQARKIIGNPAYTREQQEGAIREYITANIALKGAYGPSALSNYKLLGGKESEYWGGLGVDKKHYDPTGMGTFRIPLPTDIHPDLVVDPALLRARVSSTGADAKTVLKDVTDAIRGNYTPKDFVGKMPGFVLGQMPNFNNLQASWNKGQQVERWVAGGGFRALNERLRESGIEPQQFYKNNFGVDVALTELASGKLSKATLSALKQRVNFQQPEGWEKDRNAYIDGVKVAASVFNDLNTSTATRGVSRDNLMQAALGAFGQTAKSAMAMVSETGTNLRSLISSYAKTVGTSSTEFMQTLSMMKKNTDPKIKQQGEVLDKAYNQYLDAQTLLLKATAKGPRAFTSDNAEAQKAVEDAFTAVTNALPRGFYTPFGQSSVPTPAPAPATGGTRQGGGRPAVNNGGAQVEEVIVP